MTGGDASTRVLVSRELIDEIDRLVGQRGRRHFLEEAAAEKLRRVRLLEVAERVAGSLVDVKVPGWETPEASAAWVQALRRADDERLDVRHGLQ